MALLKEKVLSIHHWTDKTFSFKTTRNMSFRFKNGEFAMIGLEIDGKPLLRAYSVVSPNHEDHLEFLSIKVPNGPLTSKLQHITIGDEISVREKSKSLEVITSSLLNSGNRCEYVEWNPDRMVGKLISIPERSQITENIKEQLIVELYSK